MKKRICHITTVHPAKDVRIYHKMCRSLADAGYDVTLVVVNGNADEQDDIPIIPVPVKYSGRPTRFLKAPAAAARAALELKADLYHFHDPEFLGEAVRMVRKGYKVIYDVHEDLPRQLLSKHYIPGLIRPVISWIAEWYENNRASRLTGIVTATQYIHDRFVPVNRRVQAVHNYPVIDLNESPHYPGGNELSYIGSLTRVRGIREMVEAVGLLEGRVILNLAGRYEPESFRDELTLLPGWKYVREHGWAGREKVKQLLSGSFAGLVTLHPIINYRDALPVKMFEYMAAAIPVIASDIPLWQSIVEDNYCGLTVNPMNPSAIARAIEELLNNPEKAETMGQNGRRAVVNKYNWAHEAENLIDFYKSILRD
ncbi:MAG: glycosyltransferase family 4 protein [Bacteroidales bacterium]